MFNLFSLIPPFSLFRYYLGGGSTGPSVAISESGEAAITCRLIPAPSVLLDTTGLLFVLGADPGQVLVTEDGHPVVTEDGVFVLTSE